MVQTAWKKEAFAESFRKITQKLKKRWQMCFSACLPVSPLKSFSQSLEYLFLIVDKNNFSSKIPLFLCFETKKLTTIFAMHCKFIDEIRDFLELVGDPSFKAQGDKNKP